jgi:hypothetical protein
MCISRRLISSTVDHARAQAAHHQKSSCWSRTRRPFPPASGSLNVVRQGEFKYLGDREVLEWIEPDNRKGLPRLEPELHEPSLPPEPFEELLLPPGEQSR